MPTTFHASPAPIIGYWRQTAGSPRSYWSPSLHDVFGAATDKPKPSFRKVAAQFEDGAQLVAMLGRLRVGETIGPVDLWMHHPTRGRRLIRISGGLERDEPGLSAFYGVAADITDLHQTAASAAASEQLLATFIDHAPASLAMFDVDMRYLRISPRWLVDFDLGDIDIIGKTHYEIFPEIPQRWRDIHARCLAGASERCERDLFVRADGKRQWTSWEVHPWYNETGAIGGILMLTRDITELINSIETLERTERRLQLALTAGEMMVWQRDRRTGQLFVSGAFAKLMGRPARERLNDEELFSLIHADDRPEVMRQFVLAVMERRTMRHEMRIVPPTAPMFWARCDVEPLYDETGVHSGSIGLLKDISRGRAEKEELAAARETAEAASKAKSNFLATMSHEVRTPLNGVLGVAQVLAGTKLDERQRDLVNLILSAGNELKTLVDDSLDVERIESDALNIRRAPFDFSEIVAQASYLFAPAAAEKSLSFAVDLTRVKGLRLTGDAGRVRQVVSNLVGNAVKFTSKGGVDIVADATFGEDGRARFSIAVRDSGCGIDLGQQATIFERFRQGGAREGGASEGGAGLGLTIARGLARAMDGDVRCDSVPGRGSTFWFNGAAELAPRADSTAAALEIGAHAAARILVVEDHPQNRRIVELMLEPFQIDLTFADDGIAALAHFERAFFDVVLMDIQLPRMDGVETIRAFRALEAQTGRKRTPIICLTAQVGSEKVLAAREAGADGHVSKPIVLKELIESIDRSLSGIASAA